MMVIVGVALIVVGLGFIGLGFVAAARAVFHYAQPSRDLGSIDPEKWAKLVGAFSELVKVAPEWLLITLVGVALTAIGSSML
jgi:uncharacterized membrane protein